MWLACFANEQQMQSIHNKHQHYLDAIKATLFWEVHGDKDTSQVHMYADNKICYSII